MTNHQLPFTVRNEQNELEKWRHDTFWEKEPETIAWIETFHSDDMLIDIGANIGLYSLYAASRGCRVLAVEPMEDNYRAIVENKKLNLDFKIRPIWGCVANRTGTVCFRFDDSRPGATGGGIEAPRKYSQPIPVYIVDGLIPLYCSGPIHIKIDVDGDEAWILDGMRKTLKNKSIESCLVEVSDLDRDEIMDTFLHYGYDLTSPLNSMTPHSRERRLKEKINVENLIFSKTTW